MKINIGSVVSAVGMTGFGPTSLIRDNGKVSMHPALPEHIEHVAHDLQVNERKWAHHTVKRRHPENDMGYIRKLSIGLCCFSNKSKFRNCPRCKPGTKP